MPAMVLPKGSIVKVATVAAPSAKFALTEHNRGELTIDVERIERAQRTAGGRMRKWHIADKRTFNLSWEMVPHSSVHTLDGFWGGQDMQTWFNSNPGEFYLYVRTPSGTEEQVLVTFNGGLNSTVQKRGAAYEMWNLSMVLEEV